jgi:DNA-binding NarL/FixJ family response regulator
MIPARILLIDDHAIFRFGLSMALCANRDGVEIVEAESISAAMRHSESRIDIVLLDIQLPGLNGIEGIALIKHAVPGVPILIMSSRDDLETVRLATARGADGFISKVEPVEKVVAMVHQVLDGQFAKPSIETDDPALRSLTPRQCEVLDLLHQGLSNKLIARQLSLSVHTVRGHVQAILEFFRVDSRAEAVFSARSQGLVE